MPARSLQVKGCALSYAMFGDGPPVVMVQGVGVCGSGWAPQVDCLRSRYTCLTFDNRGMGASQPLGTTLTISQMAEDVLSLMDAQGWESAHVVGHSMGGLIALEAALMAPRRVRSLSLLCTFAKGRDATRLTPRMVWLGLRTRIGRKSWRRRAFLEIVTPPGKMGDPVALGERLSSLLGHDIGDQPPLVPKQLAAMSAHDVTRRLGELKGIPALVVSAQFDIIAPPASGRAIAAGIPHARYVELPGAAHSVPILDANRINDLLMDHLDR